MVFHREGRQFEASDKRMMRQLKFALSASVTLALSLPASAQQPATTPALTLNAAERTALTPLKQAVDAGNWAVASSLVPAARAGARSADARYVLARLELAIAIGTGDRAAHSAAVDAALNARRAPVDEHAELLRQAAGLAYDRGNLQGSESLLNRALALAPQDSETLSMLAQLERNRNRPIEALGLFQRASRAALAAGRALPESRYRLALAMAEQAGQRGVALELARNFIAAYANPVNWRDVLIIFRTLGTADASQVVDAWRLTRATGALAGERDYIAAAQAMDLAGFPAEAKAIIDEGVARRALGANDAAARAVLTSVNPRITRERSALAGQLAAARAATATATQARTAADAHLSHGRYAEAAELYRLALARVGEDAGLVNTRLGIALAMAGQRAESDSALRIVVGPYAEIAALWAVWLANREV
jgi:tetratricopeptide (TPR) repeat protein